MSIISTIWVLGQKRSHNNKSVKIPLLNSIAYKAGEAFYQGTLNVTKKPKTNCIEYFAGLQQYNLDCTPAAFVKSSGDQQHYHTSRHY